MALGRSFHMQTRPTADPARSPIPGVIPEPVTVHDTDAAGRRLAVRPIVHDPTRPPSSHGRSGSTGTLLARVLGVIQTHKHRALSPPTER
jgi:hypothetical protein